MSNDPAPHETAYRAVVESQAQARHYEFNNRFPSTGVYAIRSSPECRGAMFGLIFFAFHFAKDIDSLWMIIAVPVGGVAVGAFLGFLVSRTWRLTKKSVAMLFRGLVAAIKGVPREPPV